MLFDSVPKLISVTIFKESRILIAPYAKFSALEIAYKVGNSIIKSIPF